MRRAWGGIFGALAGVTALAAGCGGSSSSRAPVVTGFEAFSGRLLVATTANTLETLDANAPGAVQESIPITGLQAGETIVGMDVRPSTSELFALGSTSRLYVLDRFTGRATLVGTGPVSTTLAAATIVGFDFNPTVDRIRVVTGDGFNARINPSTGALAGTDTALAYASGDANQGTTPQVSGAAYTNSFAGSTSTTLFGIDTNLDLLVRQGGVAGSPSPNGGTLTSIGALGVSLTSITGFDIAGADGSVGAGGSGLLVGTLANSSVALFRVDLTSGAASQVGQLGTSAVPTALAFDAPTLVGLTQSLKLVGFRADRPGTLVGELQLTGFDAGETALAMDVRPSTGELYILGSSRKVYKLDAASGVATALTGTALAFTGTTGTGMDFNPAVDAIRLVTSGDENLRANATTGLLAGTDVALNPGAGVDVMGCAYDASFAGTGSTTLFALDATGDRLFRQGGVGGSPSPNGGTLTAIGNLGVDIDLTGGFDIDQLGVAWALVRTGTSAPMEVLAINLATGTATRVGIVGGGFQSDPLVALAIPAAAIPVLFAVQGGDLISFDAFTPGTIKSRAAITGLTAGDFIVAMDGRADATGTLEALGNTGRVYYLNAASGVATAVSTTTVPLGAGTQFAMDFNPTVDRIRINSDAGLNIRIHPDTAQVAGTDPAPAYDGADAGAGTTPRLVGTAYTDSFRLNDTQGNLTTIFGLELNRQALVRMGGVNGSPSPNAGTLTSVALLSGGGFPFAATPTADVGFEIVSGGAPNGGASGFGLIAITPNGAASTDLLQVNLATGACRRLGAIGGTGTVRALAAGR